MPALPVLAGGVVIFGSTALPAQAATGCWSPAQVKDLAQTAIPGSGTVTVLTAVTSQHYYLGQIFLSVSGGTAGQYIEVGTGSGGVYDQFGHVMMPSSLATSYTFDYQGLDAGVSMPVLVFASSGNSVTLNMFLSYSTVAPTSCTMQVSGTVAATQSGSWSVAASQSGSWAVGQTGSWTVTVGNASLPVTCATNAACHVTVDNASLPVSCSSGGTCHVSVDNSSIPVTQSGTWSMGESGSWSVNVGNSSLPVTCASGGSCHMTLDNASVATSQSGTWTVTVGNASIPVTCATGGACHATIDNASLPTTCTSSTCTVTLGNSSIPVTCASGGACHVTIDGQAVAVSCSAGCEGTPGAPQSVDVASLGGGNVAGDAAVVDLQWTVIAVGGLLVFVLGAQLVVKVFQR